MSADSLASTFAGKSEQEIAAALSRLDPSALVAVQAQICKDSLARFIKAAWPIVRPGDRLRWGWHLDAICEHLEAVHRGEIRKLLITVCPGSAKSLLVEVFWPAWMWANDPTRQLVCIASDGDLALRDANRHRDLVKDPWYRALFSDPAGWQFSQTQDAKGFFETTARGFRYSAGLGGSITGWRGHGVIMDDLLQAKDVLSKPAREAARYALSNIIPSRVNDLATGFFVMVQQRLCTDDPAQWAIDQGDYEHLNLPTEYAHAKRYVTHRSIRGHREVFQSDPRKEDGELLFPALFPRDVVEQSKKRDPEAHAAQHQQDPIPPGGGMFKIADWRFHKPDGAAPDHFKARPAGCYEGPANPLPRTWTKLIVSVDASFGKKTERGSFTAIHVWGAAGARRCLLERVHDRMDFDGMLRALIGDRVLSKDHPIGGVLGRWPEAREKAIEAKASGSDIINTLERQYGIAGLVPVQTGTDSKEQRANAMLPYQRAGNCELPDGAPWLADYIAEHAAFPLGTHNDDVDAQSQALARLEATPPPPPLPETGEVYARRM